MNSKDKNDFKLYLQQCTDRQVYGVLEKERAAARNEYTALAESELDRRGLADGEQFSAKM